MKKKAVVFYNRCGGAHVAAASAIARVLEPTYDVVQVNFSESFIYRVQVLTYLTRQRMNSDSVYNFMLRHGMYRLANFLGESIVPRWMRGQEKRFTRWVKERLQRERADLVVSTIPFANPPIIGAAKELGLPMVITTLDGDLRHWVVGLKGVDYSRLGFTIALNEPGCRKELVAFGIPDSHIVYAGMPVREDFLHPHKKAVARRSLGISDDAFVVMVLMGGVGQSSMVDVVRGLCAVRAGTSMPIQVIACAGRSQKLKRQIEAAVDEESKGKVTVLGFTENVAEVMAASDLLVTKSGPTSICEAVYMSLPMVVDGTLPALGHEQSHHRFVESNGIGMVVPSRKDIPGAVAELMANPEKMEAMRQAAQDMHKPDFSARFTALINVL